MKREPFGGGKKKELGLHGLVRPVETRWGLAGSPIGVVTKGRNSGAIVMRYWNTNEARAVRGKTLRLDVVTDPENRLVSDLYTALRKMDHILKTYNDRGTIGEKESLQRALQIAWQLHDQLIGLRVETLSTLDAQIRSSAKRLLDVVGLKPHDPFKRVVRNSASSLLNVLDSRDQVNQTAKLAQVVSIRRQLYRRLMMIQSIEPNIFRLQRGFYSLVEEAEHLFSEASAYLDEALTAWLGVFAEEDRLLRDERNMLVVRLNHFADELERLDIDPYRRPCQRMARELRKAAEYITARRYRAAATMVRRTNESLKLRRMRTDVECFISFLNELLCHPRGQISRAEAGRIRHGLLNILKRLGTVDEYRFKHPVCRQARRLVNAAITVFGRIERGPASGLKELKDVLKKTAHLL